MPIIHVLFQLFDDDFEVRGFELDIDTTQKIKGFIKGFFNKCHQIRSFLWIWSHLLMKPLIEALHFLCSEWYFDISKTVSNIWHKGLIFLVETKWSDS